MKCNHGCHPARGSNSTLNTRCKANTLRPTFFAQASSRANTRRASAACPTLIRTPPLVTPKLPCQTFHSPRTLRCTCIHRARKKKGPQGKIITRFRRGCTLKGTEPGSSKGLRGAVAPAGLVVRTIEHGCRGQQRHAAAVVAAVPPLANRRGRAEGPQAAARRPAPPALRLSSAVAISPAWRDKS